jgi:glutaredoxin
MILARSAVALLLLALAAGATQAQQIYRWTDEKGRVHVTDTPPPPGAKSVQQQRSAGGSAEAQMPYQLAQAMKDFPVVLYTSPGCKEPCAMARGSLNKRGVPFKEVLVWDDQTTQELQRVSGATEVPILLVGRNVQRGYEQGAFDVLLDSARYPKAGILPARSQAAPPAPEGYQPPGEQAKAPAAEPASAQEEQAPRGPYAPGAPPQRTQRR